MDDLDPHNLQAVLLDNKQLSKRRLALAMFKMCLEDLQATHISPLRHNREAAQRTRSSRLTSRLPASRLVQVELQDGQRLPPTLLHKDKVSMARLHSSITNLADTKVPEPALLLLLAVLDKMQDPNTDSAVLWVVKVIKEMLVAMRAHMAAVDLATIATMAEAAQAAQADGAATTRTIS